MSSVSEDDFAPNCAQSMNGVGPGLTGSEDCLYLNIWTKQTERIRLRPVLLFLHGGALLSGSSSATGYSPNVDLLHQIDVVAVSIAYRLNVFGFLTLNVLTGNSSSKSSGNYGIIDAIQSLKWIHRNIEAFGGDKHLVTVLGHSAGAKILYALLASPMAKGLLHRAIAMSGPPVYSRTMSTAAKDNSVYIDRANCTRNTSREILECLYNLSSEKALASVPWFEFPYWAPSEDGFNLPVKEEFNVAFAVIDPTVVPVSPFDLGNQTKFEMNYIPLLITTTAQECEIQKSRSFSEDTFYDKLLNTLGSFRKTMVRESLKYYLPDSKLKDINYGLTYVNMATDVRVTCPNSLLAERLSHIKGAEVYRLVSAKRPDNGFSVANDAKVYAFHGFDIIAFFGFKLSGAGNIGESKLYNATKMDLKFSNILQQEIFHFMKYGKPKHKDWLFYPNTTAVYGQDGMSIQREDFAEEKCKYWNSNNLFRYGWML